MAKKNRPPPPSPEELTFDSPGSRVMYSYVIDLYRRVGNLEGTQKVLLALLLVILSALVSVAVKVFTG